MNTEQDWPPDRIPACLITTNTADWKEIANAHNAALAAEREVGGNTAIALAQQITKLEEQLAAERSKVKELEEELNEAVKLLKLADIDAAIAKIKK